MKNLLFLLMSATVVLTFQPVSAQDFSSEVKEKIGEFDFIIGTWKGEGWVFTPQGKETSSVTENIQYGVENTIIRMEGKGVKKLEDGSEQIVHDALGILSYDVFRKKYKLNSFIARGMQTEASIELGEDGKVIWWFDAGPSNTIRYTLNVKDGRWNEIGEMSSDGENWRQFFEMNLEKVN